VSDTSGDERKILRLDTFGRNQVGYRAAMHHLPIVARRLRQQNAGKLFAVIRGHHAEAVEACDGN